MGGGGGRKYHGGRGPKVRLEREMGGRGHHTDSRHPRETMEGRRSPHCAEGAPGVSFPPPHQRPGKGPPSPPLSLCVSPVRAEVPAAGDWPSSPCAKHCGSFARPSAREERGWEQVVSPPHSPSCQRRPPLASRKGKAHSSPRNLHFWGA